jgi:hypothetical protein
LRRFAGARPAAALAEAAPHSISVRTTAKIPVVAEPAVAHHSANAEFDTAEIVITGVLTKVENVNRTEL